MLLRISDRLQLRSLAEADAGELHALIEANRQWLSPWLRWAATQTLADTVRFIRDAAAQLDTSDGFQAAIVIDNRIAGVVGFTGVDWENGSTSLGYWLAVEHEGHGIMTAAVRAMVDHALRAWKLNRVEIRVAVENSRSRAVPERLGFRQEGILREAERVGDRYLDAVLYSMLADDWPDERAAQKTGDSV